MTLASLVCVSLSSLYLCADCRAVSNDARRCLGCGNEHGLLNLANVLDRETSRATNPLNEMSTK